MWVSLNYKRDLVSVIVPTFNRADVLVDAMESVFHQTYRPVELVIVDDGSTDSTDKVVAAFSENVAHDDLFLVQFISKTNEGSQIARNTGVRASRGEYVQFLDSDDILHGQKLANAVKLYKENPSLDLVYSRWLVDNGRRLIEMTGPSPGAASLLSEAVLHNLCIFSPVYRRRDLLTIGPFNEELSKAQDIEYCTRTINRTKKIARDEHIGGVYRLGKTQSSIIGSINSDKLHSEWSVNRWQKRLLRAEPPVESRAQALALLLRRDQSIAARSIAGHCPGLGLKIMLTEHRIWVPVTPKETAKRIVLTVRLLIEQTRRVFGKRR